MNYMNMAEYILNVDWLAIYGKQALALSKNKFEPKELRELRQSFDMATTDDARVRTMNEYAEVISWNQKGPRYALIETASFPDERRTTFSIWDDWRDIIDHLFGVLQDRVQMYKVCKIYTYPNFFRDLLSHRKYVKYHLHKIEEIDGGV